MSLRFRALRPALALALLAAPGAHAADSISLTHGADPTEEVLTPITARWSSAEASVRVIVTKKLGVAGCAGNAAADLTSGTLLINHLGGASGGRFRNWMLHDPGTLTVCGFLQRTNGAVLAVSGPLQVNYRSGRSRVAIEAPPRVTPGSAYKLVAPTYSELARHLEVTVKPSSPRGCAPSYPVDSALSDDLMYWKTQGTHRWTKPIKAPSANGLYLLCAYVSDHPADPVPEATASAMFEVGPDLCADARAGLVVANRTLRAAERAVTRYRRSYRRYERRARRTHGARHARNVRLAKRDRRRYDHAVTQRDSARTTVASAQAQVTTTCGG
jgi:hypothetical protein